MKDPILDNIYKARAKLLKEHGGWEGFYKHILECEQVRLARQKAAKKRARAKAKTRAR